MEWWYKTEKYDVTDITMRKLQDALTKELRSIGSLRIANLYDDHEFFYIKTTNNIALHNFLYNHEFEELYEGQPEVELFILYGIQ